VLKRNFLEGSAFVPSFLEVADALFQTVSKEPCVGFDERRKMQVAFGVLCSKMF
jgi:hypothetical protein